MNSVTNTLAYKFVALTLMIGEANAFLETTGLKLDHPITQEEVRSGSHVAAPDTQDFGGSVLTDTHFFGFGWGHLANFYRRDLRPDSESTIKEQNARLSKLTSLIDTNLAYKLATSWLSALGISVAELERKYHPTLSQWRYYPRGQTSNAAMLPVYQVQWRGHLFPKSRRELNVVTLTILGSSKELIEYHVLDNALFMRPGLSIPQPEALLSISDHEFMGLDALQRSNLVMRYVGKELERARRR